MQLGSTETLRAWREAVALSVATIIFNILEGVISTLLGARDESLALLGFGIDSFAEIASGFGIFIMTWRLWRHPSASKSSSERRAFQITSISFFLISIALLISAFSSLINGRSPSTTLPGVFISLFSIVVMLILVRLKRQVGKTLSSKPILADARCGEVCIYMSVVLLISSLLFSLTGIAFMDAVGAFALALLSLKEGRASWKASLNSSDSCCSC